jgi:hypothetical protein
MPLSRSQMYPSYKFAQDAFLRAPKGWYRLACDFLHELQALSEAGLLPKEFKVQELSERNGGLYVACSPSPLAVDRLVIGYAVQASCTCQDCGYAAASLCINPNGWKRVLCTACAGERYVRVDTKSSLAKLST